MSTALVVSVTDELVEQLSALTCRDEGGAVLIHADQMSALLAERAELLRDAKRLDWFIKECCVMECANGSASPVVYRIYWSHEAEGQREWYASPRKAIDAAMQYEAKP
jgi:hypothetical protein